MRYDELRAIVRQYDETSPSGPLFWRLAVIDDAAQTACGDLAPWIMDNVARGVTWERMQAPCCRKTFYQTRVRFFEELNRRLQEVAPFEVAGRVGPELSRSSGFPRE